MNEQQKHTKLLQCILAELARQTNISNDTPGSINIRIQDVVRELQTVNSQLTELTTDTTEIQVKLDTVITKLTTQETLLNTVITELGTIKTSVAEISTNTLNIDNKLSTVIKELQDIETLIKNEFDETQALQTEQINKPLPTEIVGCISYRQQSNTSGFNLVSFGNPNAQPNNTAFALYLWGVGQGGSGARRIFPGETFDSKQILFADRWTAQQLQNEINRVWAGYGATVTKQGNALVVNFTDNRINRMTFQYENFAGTTAGTTISYEKAVTYTNIKENGSLVKEFDKVGNEIVAKRKYYVNGTEISASVVTSFNEGECTEILEETRDKPEATEIAGCISYTKNQLKAGFVFDNLPAATSSVPLALQLRIGLTPGGQKRIFASETFAGGTAINFTDRWTVSQFQQELNSVFPNAGIIVTKVNNTFQINPTKINNPSIASFVYTTTTDLNTLIISKDFQSTDIKVSSKESGSLVKFFDKIGDEITAKRKYYINGQVIAPETISSFKEGGCNDVNLSEVEGRLNTLITGINTINSNLGELTTDTTAIQTQLTGIATQLTSQDTKLSTVITELQAVKTSVASIDTDTTTIISKLDTVIQEANDTQTLLQTEFDQSQALLTEIVSKPEVTEIKGCLKIKIDSVNPSNSTYGLYGLSIQKPTPNPVTSDITFSKSGSTIKLFLNGENIDNVNLNTLSNRFKEALIEMGKCDYSNSVEIIRYGNFIGIISDFPLIPTTDLAINTSPAISPIIYFNSSNAGDFFTNVNGSVAKKFNKLGSEIISERTYYNNSQIVPSNQVISFNEKECSEIVIKSILKQEIVSNTTKTYSDYKSLSFTVTQGTATVKIGTDTFTYPIGSVIGGEIDSENGISTPIEITTASVNDKVLVTYKK